MKCNDENGMKRKWEFGSVMNAILSFVLLFQNMKKKNSFRLKKQNC